MSRVTIGDVADLVGGAFSGDRSIRIDRVRTLSEAGPNDLSFLGNPKYGSQLDASSAGAILVAAKQPGAAAFLLQTPATPPPQDQSVVGSTDRIVAMGVIIVLIVLVPILVRRKSWTGH